MLNAYGFLSKIFSIFNQYQTPVDLVATSEVSVSMTIEDTSRMEEITRDLSSIGEVRYSQDNAILCLVGPKLWKESSFVTQVFGALHFTDLKLITLGSSDINLSMVIPANDLSPAIAGLHKKFFEGK
jgi:aspartate kinase